MSASTPKVVPTECNSELFITVKCGQKTAQFYPMQMKKSGKTVGKCVKYQGRWITPNEFENTAGVPARKWKNSIKHDGKPLGEWLVQNMLVESSQTSSQIQVSCQLETQLENQQLKGNANHTYSDNDLVTDNGQGCQVELDTSASTNAHESSTMVPSNTHDSLSCLDFDSLLSGLEKKLLISLKGIISEAVQTLKSCFESELLAMKLQVDRHQSRVAELESKKPSLEPLPSAPLQESEGTRIPNVRMSTASPEAMETKMA